VEFEICVTHIEPFSGKKKIKRRKKGNKEENSVHA
jgi:hypothetical protein